LIKKSEFNAMKPATKRTASIVGVSALSIGLLVGTGFAANAATTGITTALHQTSSVTPTSTTTPTPVRTPGPRHNDANDNDANDNDANEHATPEPGDDDAPGTPDHHGANRGPGKAPAPAPAPSSGGEHDGNDDNGHGGSGHGGNGHDANDND
jgi:hypothetical protein